MFSFFFKKSSTQPNKVPMVTLCPDCQVKDGKIHVLFCLKERCPFCDGQLARCECIGTVLKLSKEEQEALDECEDDSIPPVSDIMARWKKALDDKGRIPFRTYPDDPYRAAARNDMTVINQFFALGMDANHVNEVRHTPIMAASYNAAVEVVQLFLSKGATVTNNNDHGRTALYLSVASPVHPQQVPQQLKAITLLLEAGADVNARCKTGGTPLMSAAWFGCTEAVKKLLSAGADPSIRDDRGRTAWDLAGERKHAEIQWLLSERR